MGNDMRLAFEVLLAVFGLYAAFYIVNINEQYADMVASVNDVYWCDVQFNESVASMPCTVTGKELAKVSMK
jgi:hypothetical protein